MWANPQETVDLVTFTEEMLNGKLPFCAVVRTSTFTQDYKLEIFMTCFLRVNFEPNKSILHIVLLVFINSL